MTGLASAGQPPKQGVCAKQWHDPPSRLWGHLSPHTRRRWVAKVALKSRGKVRHSRVAGTVARLADSQAPFHQQCAGGVQALATLERHHRHAIGGLEQPLQGAHAHTQRLAKLASILGIALDGLPSDRRLGPEDFAAPTQPVRSRTHAELLLRRIANDRPTLENLLALPEVVSSAHWQVIGTPTDAVEQILAWRAADAIDGFIALPGGSLGSLALFLDQVVPTLQAAGVLKTAYRDAGPGQATKQG